MSKLAKALTAAAGNAGGDNLYVEDVFSTYLYTGTGAAQTITNGIDLAGEGGLVWGKVRANGDHYLRDTERGGSEFLSSNSTSASSTVDTYPVGNGTAFNSDGFSIGPGGAVNGNGFNFASWTFRKAEKFFDVVTYTTTGTGGTQILSHNLGSVPAFILLKKTSSTGNWWAIHSSVTSPSANWWQNTGVLEGTNAFFQGDLLPSEPTDTEIALGPTFTNAGNEGTYVAYLFASDAGGFGDDGSESIIKCGSYTEPASGEQEITLGFEPQFILVKRTDAVSDWQIFDVMRSMSHTNSIPLRPNSSGAEFSFGNGYYKPTPTGFIIKSGAFGSGSSVIYIAIRRPMKTPESGTEVFSPDLANASVAPLWEAPFPVDLGMYAKRDSATATFYAGTRLTGTGRLSTWTTTAEVTDGSFKWDYMDGWFNNAFTDSQYLGYGFKRATGFFDVVAYTGDGINARQITHNLKAEPELIISKKRSATSDWIVYAKNNGIAQNAQAILNGNNSFGWYAGLYPSPYATDSVYYIASAAAINQSGQTYIAYLFASLAGVSKVGSYTGTGSNVDVDCGFSAGARFILIKRTDSTGDWYVWDSVRGIVAGNDPYLLLNSTAAEVTTTDYIDPLASGFTVTSSAPAALNASGGTYIFLAIA